MADVRRALRLHGPEAEFDCRTMLIFIKGCLAKKRRLRSGGAAATCLVDLAVLCPGSRVVKMAHNNAVDADSIDRVSSWRLRVL